jgi:hypothetical protein
VKLILNCEVTTSSKWKISCANQNFICGSGKHKLSLDIDTCGWYEIDIEEKAKTPLVSLISAIGYPVIMLILVIALFLSEQLPLGELFKSDGDSWASRIRPYSLKSKIKIQVNNDRKISIKIYPCEYQRAINNWTKPVIEVKRVSPSNITQQFILDTSGFKYEKISCYFWLSLLFLLFALCMLIAVKSGVLWVIIVCAILCTAALTGFSLKLFSKMKDFKTKQTLAIEWFAKNLADK